MHKEAHGSGRDLDLPDAEQVDVSMAGYDQDHMVDVYGPEVTLRRRSGGLLLVAMGCGSPIGTAMPRSSKLEGAEPFRTSHLADW